MTRRTGMSALMSVGTTMALMGMALAQSGSPSPAPSGSGSSSMGAERGYSSDPRMSGSGGSSYGAPGGSQTAGAIDSTTTSQTTTTDYAADGAYGAAPVGDTAPLDNTGGEPLMLTLLGSLVAGSALLMRRKLSTN